MGVVRVVSSVNGAVVVAVVAGGCWSGFGFRDWRVESVGGVGWWKKDVEPNHSLRIQSSQLGHSQISTR